MILPRPLLSLMTFLFALSGPGFVWGADAVSTALERAGRNKISLQRALDAVTDAKRQGMMFLITHMPEHDLRSLKTRFLLENVDLAYRVRGEVPWGRNIPEDIFLNEVLPYASLNERRDNWRRDFYTRFIHVAREQGTIEKTVLFLNKVVFDTLKVSYHATKRPKPDQSPYESMKAHYASCTGLSILLVDALRAVGIPARITGTAMWPDESGNHTWVEFWNGSWHYVGAAESDAVDQAWFSEKAASAGTDHLIYASSFRRTGVWFPLRWAPERRDVPAVDVTARYVFKEQGAVNP